MKVTIDVPDEFIQRLITALDNWKSRQFWNPEGNAIDDLLQRVVEQLNKK